MNLPENSPIVEMSLTDAHFQSEMLENLKSAVKSRMFEPERDCEKSLLMAIDHCFAVKGKGTVLTGTVIQGILKLGDEIELPAFQERRRLKSLETWKTSVDQVLAGERAAFLIPSFDSHRFSRCLIGATGSFRAVRTVLATVEPIVFFRSKLSSKVKMHISVAFETVMAECQFLEKVDEEYEQLPGLESSCLVVFTFEKPIFLPENFEIPFMASRLEQQPGKGCRFAFSGKFLKIYDEKSLESLKKFTRKVRKGTIERIEKDGYSAICTGMFKAETNFDVFRNFLIITSSGKCGKIEGAFGKSGKFRIVFDQKIDEILTEKSKISLFLKKYSDGKLVSYVANSEKL
uniref:DUF663 domain-containing protein n=1 Tax=Caenorhabditis japonica TaxID=281687 RepID=A0A8R1HT30_CAEJA